MAILGTLLALTRITTSAVMFPLRVVARLYTTIMRGIPMIVVLYLIGFGIPGLGIFGRMDPAVLGTVAIIMSYSAYIAEVLRAGFQDVHPSQRASARSLGLTSGQTMRLVIIPQALRKMAPALMNDFISMQKDVGLISTLGAVDAVRAAQIVVAKTYNFTPYVVASVLFILLSVPFILLNDWYSAKLRRREQTGGRVYCQTTQPQRLPRRQPRRPTRPRRSCAWTAWSSALATTWCWTTCPLTSASTRSWRCWDHPAPASPRS